MKAKKTTKDKKVKDFKVEMDSLRNQLARALADYDNMRKRVEKEKDDFLKIANIKLAVRFLPVYDMLESAQKHLQDSGIALTLREFEDVLRDEGIEKIDVKPGSMFDEKLHDVVETDESKGKKGEVSQVVQTGWIYQDGQVVRPAKVRVKN